MKKLIIVLFVIFGLFYWYQIRPSNIRKKCYNFAKSEIIKYKIKLDSAPYYANLSYESCLSSNGLKPEKLFIK